MATKAVELDCSKGHALQSNKSYVEQVQSGLNVALPSRTKIVYHI